MTDRYEGKPFLRLLDCYVLDAIDHLPAAQEVQLTALEPGFRDAFGDGEDWRAIVAGRMQFPEGMRGAIREIWEKGTAKFIAANGQEPDPAEFARFFVDTHFPH